MNPSSTHTLLTAGRASIYAGALVVAAATATPALAAEVYYQPIATLGAETDSNLDLDPGNTQRVEGYVADLATVVGIDTPDWQTLLRPRVVYRYYPEESADDRLEAFLDINSTYHTQRSTATLTGSLQRLDEFNAEQTTGVFNDINPNQPIPDTGRTTVGAVRDSAILYPKYTYSLTPTVSVGANGQYQLVEYSPSDFESHVNFDYYLARAFVGWQYDQRSTLSFGAYGTKYEARDFESTANGKGGTVDLDTNWTPLFVTKLSLLYQSTDFDDVLPTPFRSTVHAWGGLATGTYKTQVDQYRVIAGRQLSPSGGGSLYDIDRIQFQYDRDLTARWSVTAALVGIKTHALTANIAGDDRKYANTVVETHYALTQHWFVQGGYQYAWQKYQYDVDSASNNRFYVEFGYKGLGQQR